jgi:hypothetical protein
MEPSSFPVPCRDAFEHLAEADPARLAARILRGDLGRAHLGYAAEALGRGTEGETSHAVIEVLRGLLAHESPLVREGAIYGLAHHRTARVDSELRRVAAHDVSPGVREAAADVLEEG